MEKGFNKKDGAKTSECVIKTQDPYCIGGKRVSKLLLIIDERCKDTKILGNNSSFPKNKIVFNI